MSSKAGAEAKIKTLLQQREEVIEALRDASLALSDVGIDHTDYLQAFLHTEAPRDENAEAEAAAIENRKEQLLQGVDLLGGNKEEIKELEDEWPLKRSWIQVLLYKTRHAFVSREHRAIQRIVEDCMRDGFKVITKSWLLGWLSANFPVDLEKKKCGLENVNWPLWKFWPLRLKIQALGYLRKHRAWFWKSVLREERSREFRLRVKYGKWQRINPSEAKVISLRTNLGGAANFLKEVGARAVAPKPNACISVDLHISSLSTITPLRDILVRKRREARARAREEVRKQARNEKDARRKREAAKRAQENIEGKDYGDERQEDDAGGDDDDDDEDEDEEEDVEDAEDLAIEPLDATELRDLIREAVDIVLNPELQQVPGYIATKVGFQDKSKEVLRVTSFFSREVDKDFWIDQLSGTVKFWPGVETLAAWLTQESLTFSGVDIQLAATYRAPSHEIIRNSEIDLRFPGLCNIMNPLQQIAQSCFESSAQDNVSRSDMLCATLVDAISIGSFDQILSVRACAGEHSIEIVPGK